MKRNISMMLCLSLIAASAVSCAGGSDQTPTETQQTTTEPVVTEEVIPLPEADFGAADFKILTAAEQWQSFYTAEQTGEPIDDAVFNRNRAVEERYNVNLDYQVYNGYNAGKEAVRTAITGSVMGGSAEFDLMVGGVSYVTPLTMDNVFTDLYQFDVLAFDQPWWYSYINNELELCEKLYLGSGAYGMLATANAIVTYFNKQVAENHNMEDLYTLVNDGKWTFEKMSELSKTVSADLNGDGKYAAEDLIGIISTSDYMSFLVNSMGYFYTNRTDGGRIHLNEPAEKLIDISARLNDLLAANYYIDAQDLGSTQTSDDVYQNMMNMFSSDQALFMMHRLEFATRETMRNMEKYGILPTPKYDEAQTSYLTSVVNDVAAIPGVVKDTDMSATILEALQYYTYTLVQPQYFEIALKRKGTRDEASLEMLELIFDTPVCDFTYMYLDLIGSELFMGINQKNYASWAEKNYKKFRTNIEKIVSTVEGFES